MQKCSTKAARELFSLSKNAKRRGEMFAFGPLAQLGAGLASVFGGKTKRPVGGREKGEEKGEGKGEETGKELARNRVLISTLEPRSSGGAQFEAQFLGQMWSLNFSLSFLFFFWI